jgi:primosomal protein N' (replication factor Y)
MEEALWVVEIAVARPVHSTYHYRITEAQRAGLRKGMWVLAPFGRTKVLGFVVAEPIQEGAPGFPEVPREKLKGLMEVGDPESALAPEIFALCAWAADYYRAPLGEILQAASPAAVLGLKTRKRVAREVQRERDAPPLVQTLSPDQETALAKLREVRDSGKSLPVLLEGVTGSGKTEVYLAIARDTLARGQGVLILVPEIALTPQLHERFERGLGEKVALWHSALSDGARRDQAAALRTGALRVVVGARSAVFAPVRELGLIVVDEEHDATYKQEDRVRYHARDLAVVRGRNTGALVVLGSATPSLESRARVREGKYEKALLPRRIGAGGMPEILRLDLGELPRVEGTQAPLALQTIEEIRSTLQAGEQVLIFLNRRGFAAFLLCEDCGEVCGCPHCSISLTFHKSRRELRCHLCGHVEVVPPSCPHCQGSTLTPMGAGTESLEEELPRWVPEARTLRLDRDQISSASRLEAVLEEFRAGHSNVLLGTQMLVKGHDFPGVTLVVVVLADALFRWPDFRAPERALQTLLQVAGRAGRAEKRGRVLIQTFQPEHPVLQVLCGERSVEAFLDEELEVRATLGYPPLGRMVRLRWESDSREDVMARSRRLADLCRVSGEGRVEVLGPSEALVERVRGIFRWDVLLKSQDIRALHRVVRQAQQTCDEAKWPMTVDVDPQSIG